MASNTETHHEAAKPGMPQLDPTYFASQLFWLAVVLVAMYVLMSRWAVPRIARVVESREQRIATDITQAEEARAHAQSAVESYEKTMQEAKNAANASLTEAQRTMADHQSAELAKLDAQLLQQIQNAESRIRATAQETQAKLESEVSALSDLIVSSVLQIDPRADVGAKKMKA